MKITRIISAILALVMFLSVFALVASAEEIDFTTKEVNGKIYGIPVGATASDVKTRYYSSVIEITDTDGIAIADSAKMANGYIVKLNATTYRAVVYGDVNSDAVVNSQDYTLIKRAFLGTATVDSLALEAAGVQLDDGEKLSAQNYVFIKRMVMGTYDMNYEYNCDPYDPEKDADENGWTDFV